MLQNLHVKNLALIDEIEVDFKEGLNILTGETGAGKSILLGSVNLALGGRYNADMLRKGADFGLVELTFFVKEEKLMNRLKELEIYPEDGIVVLSRRLMDGRSVSRINGETVQAAKLRETASVLIDIHGQHEHQSLLYKKNHLAILDAFAKEEAAPLKEKVETAYRKYRSCMEELKRLKTDEAERTKEIDFLEFEISEIQKANLRPGEDEGLEEQYRFMVNSKKMAENLEEAYGFTSGSNENASEFLSRAIRSLQDISGYDKRAEELYGQLVEIDSLLNDFNRELSDYSSSLEFSPEEFYAVEERLNEINRLKTKYGNSVEDILNYCEEKEARLSKLLDYDFYMEQLSQKLAASEEALKEQSEALTTLRKGYAETLKEMIRNGLQELNFLEVAFEISFERLPSYTANGIDEIEFLISMNPGEEVKPLGEVASGGELSRIMLAIKTALADKDEIETLIFDEIDVGISGRTAQKVSEKMKVIGKSRQVICITHLAQIAAMADVHFLIEKAAKDGVTKTSIQELDEQESIRELARILGGAQITDTVIKNAAEMKDLAKKIQ